MKTKRPKPGAVQTRRPLMPAFVYFVAFTEYHPKGMRPKNMILTVPGPIREEVMLRRVETMLTAKANERAPKLGPQIVGQNQVQVVISSLSFLEHYMVELSEEEAAAMELAAKKAHERVQQEMKADQMVSKVMSDLAVDTAPPPPADPDAR